MIPFWIITGLVAAIVGSYWVSGRNNREMAGQLRELRAKIADKAPVEREILLMPRPTPPETVETREPPSIPSRSPPADRGASMFLQNREANLAARRQAFDKQIQQHWLEPIDSPWADSASSSLRTNLVALGANNGFQVKDVSCRNVTCVATAEWKTREEAVSSVRTLLQNRYEINCGRSMYLPETDSASGNSFGADILFDCADWKKAGSTPRSAAH